MPAWSAGEMGLKVHTGIAVSVGGVVSVKLRKLIPYLVRKVERMVVGNVDRSTEIARRLGAYRRRLDATCGLLFTSKNGMLFSHVYILLHLSCVRLLIHLHLRHFSLSKVLLVPDVEQHPAVLKVRPPLRPLRKWLERRTMAC